MRRPLLAWSLILYGVLGFALVLGGAMIGLELASRIERLATTADGTLAAAVRSTDAAADAFTNVDGSLSEAETSAAAAGALARDASGTLASLARAMELSVFGAQPLLPLAGEFDASAEQASALGETLDRVGGSLGATRTDVTSIGTELDELSVQLAGLRDANGSGGTAPPLRPFVILLLSWLLVPAVGGLLAGLALLRRPRTSP
ncbi:MAG: hypothetical protein H0W17_04760 [Chloroflexi bacterium]|nr:hypothetical protein [Chloroflexota bacterium]HEV8053822.1 hypothetical protein [Candidatus Limnocylindrales bacterium]